MNWIVQWQMTNERCFHVSIVFVQGVIAWRYSTVPIDYFFSNGNWQLSEWSFKTNFFRMGSEPIEMTIPKNLKKKACQSRVLRQDSSSKVLPIFLNPTSPPPPTPHSLQPNIPQFIRNTSSNGYEQIGLLCKIHIIMLNTNIEKKNHPPKFGF